MAEHNKDFNQAKSDFVTALLESINGLSWVKAVQQLSSIIAHPRVALALPLEVSKSLLKWR